MEGYQNCVRTLYSESYNEFNKDLIIDMIMNLAEESENKKLDRELIYQSVSELINTPNFGFYQISSLGDVICGMNLVTYEYNIESSKKVIWLQTVYVNKEHRSKGVFKGLLRKLCEITKSTNDNFHNTLKLYMERDNKIAHQVYLKSGFKVSDDILFELDFYFDKFQRDEYITNFPSNIYLKQVLNDNLSFIEKEIKSNLYLDFCKSGENDNLTEDISAQLTSIKYVVENQNCAEVLMLIDENTGTLIALVYIFFEYSDWRKSLFWWVYSLKVNVNHKDFVVQNMNTIIKSLIDIALKLNRCGLRIIANCQAENRWNNLCIPRSHYLIFEKIVDR